MSKPRVRLKPTAEAIDAPVVSAGISPAFHGASQTMRDIAGWIPARGSADADILGSDALNQLTYRARDIHRNNGVAHAGVQTIVDNVVGTGLRLSPNPDYLALNRTKEWAVEWSRKMSSLYHSWWHSTACHAGDTMTGDQLTAQVMFSKINNGASLTLPLWIPDRGDGYATKLQTVEIDRLSNPFGQPEARYFRGGIEFDIYGAPQWYNIRRGHPGEMFIDPTALDTGIWDRIPRRTSFGRMRVIHDFDAERSGQSRGVPLMASILPQFKNLDRYQQAELQAAVMNAMIFGTITTPLSGDDIVDLFSKDPAAYLKAREEAAVRMQSGSLLALQPGDELKEFMPQRPATNFQIFNTNIYRIIAVALDIPYELLLKDFSQTTYSSARAAMLEAWRSFSRRRDWLGTMWLDPIYCLFAEEVVNAGLIEAPDFYAMRGAYLRCRWIGPGKGWVDPVKEAQAAGIRVNNNLSTLEQECADQGQHWEEVLEQRSREQEKMDELGLTMDDTAAYPVDTSSDAPPGTNESDNPPPPKKKKTALLAAPQPVAGLVELAQAMSTLAGSMAAIAARPAIPADVRVENHAAPVVFPSEAIRIEPAITHVHGNAREEPLAGLQRSQEIIERDPDGRVVLAVTTEVAPAIPAVPARVVRKIEKRVTARDKEGRILALEETELVPAAS
jgi:lambda family phage portal protein